MRAADKGCFRLENTELRSDAPPFTFWSHNSLLTQLFYDFLLFCSELLISTDVSIDYRFIVCVCVACFIELLLANDKNPLHQKEPEGFAGFDEQLHFLSLQTEYYDPEWGQQPNGDVYGLFTGGAFKNMNMWTRLLAYVTANWAVVTGVLSADAGSVTLSVAASPPGMNSLTSRSVVLNRSTGQFWNLLLPCEGCVSPVMN